MKLIIWDYDVAPEKTLEGNLLLWRCHNPYKNSKIVSIPTLVETKAELLRSQYLKWIYELGEIEIDGKRLIDYLEIRNGFSYWWMTCLAEKCSSSSNYIPDVIRLFAFWSWVSGKTIESIKLIGPSRELSHCLRIWADKNGVEFSHQSLKRKSSNKKLSLKKLYFSLPSIIRGLVWLARYCFEARHLKGVGIKSWKKSTAKVTFISYFSNLDKMSLRKGEFQNTFWNSLPKNLDSWGIKTNWLHIFERDEFFWTKKNQKRIFSSLNETGTGSVSHVCLASFLTFKIVIKSLKDWMHLRKKCRVVTRIIKNETKLQILWPMFRKDWQSSIFGETSISKILAFNLFNSAFSMIPKQEKGIYLKENQGWELGLINNWNQYNHGDIIGFAHVPIRYWDLRYFFDPRSYKFQKNCNLPLPHKVAVNGKISYRIFAAGEFPRYRILEVEALRQIHLSESIVETNIQVGKNNKNKKKRLLVIGDYLETVTKKQLNLLEETIPRMFDDVEIILKPHNNCPVDIKKYPLLKMNIDIRPLSFLFKNCDMVYSSSRTGAAVEAYYIGLPIAIHRDNSDLNLSSLRNFEGVTFVSSSSQLLKFFKQSKNNLRRAANADSMFFLDVDLRRWKKLLVDINSDPNTSNNQNILRIEHF